MPVRNVTIAPSERAISVENPEIKEIRSTRSGQILDARRFISGRSYYRLVEARNLILESMKRGQPRLVCAICGTPVYLVARADKSFFFRHRIEDGSCPARTRGRLSQEEIRARKYQGARESDNHKIAKARLESSLNCDPNASEVRSESRWRSLHDPSTYRKPDVQAVFARTRLAFEVQLTTTFLDVVVGRRMFYRDEGALLIWVLRCFDPRYRRLTEDDILFTNNSNIFVVDAETTKASIESSKCLLRCHYRRPYIEGRSRKELWESRLVGLDEITFDMENQRAYWFDFEAAETDIRDRVRKLDEQYRRETEERLLKYRTEQETQLRAAVLNFFKNRSWEGDLIDDVWPIWQSLVREVGNLGVRLPRHYEVDGFRGCICALLSAQYGRPIGFRYKKLVEVAHLIAESHKQCLLLFGWMLKIHGHDRTLEAEDKSGKWRLRKSEFKREIRSDSPEYRPDQAWLPAVMFLFPELAEKVGG